MTVTLNVAVLLAVVAVLLARRAPAPRKRSDAWLTTFLVLSLGLLLYPTPTGQWAAGILRTLILGMSRTLSDLAL